MRIQHNIAAMSSYRNYTNNVSAVNKNLEKLSSGYKINRAGDDAAGLAISEKMRAQISGLEAAQKNAKDGISLVQTAEGALTEVHDMLNRMVTLATQSANGTYDDATDREQLQKELDQLKAEIDRIADSSNFNGIKLLDGSMSTSANKITGDARIISEVYSSGNAAELSGTKTFLDGEIGTPETPTEFKVDFTGLTAKDAEATGGTPATNAVTAVYDSGTVTKANGNSATDTLSIGGHTVTIDTTQAANQDLSAQLQAFITDYNNDASKEYTAALNDDGDGIKFTAKTAGAINGDGPSAAPSNANVVTAGADATAATPGTSANGVEYTFTIGGTEFKGDYATTNNKLADGSTATGIATAVNAALTAAATAAGTSTASAAGGPTVKINGNNYSWTDNGDGTITFKLEDTPTDDNIAANFDWDIKGVGADSFDGNHTAGVVVTTPGSVYKDAPLANTVFKLEANDIKDGTKISIDGVTVTLAVGKNSAYKTEVANGTVAAAGTDGSQGYIDLTWMEEGSVDLNQAISAISKGFSNGTTNFIVGTNDTSNSDTHAGLTVHKKAASTETYDTKPKLAGVFSVEKKAGSGLTLQIGDTADTYNQLNVSINDCHSAALGISGVDISTQAGAQSALDAIKDAINKVSDVRGTLGATQNRLEHTINNLSVMTENIQDAESTIRDTDIAEEMMAYTKNNILVQSAQAMLAQANQIPQGVLQLLG